MKIGIIKEEKAPQDSRVPLTPHECADIKGLGEHEIVVQSSSVRKFVDSEYLQEGVEVTQDVTDCDILLGVKEVPIASLIEGKTYFIFSHTIKKQSYNRDLLRAIIDKKITLIDYEVLTDAQGLRLIAFGKFAGMVGAHNALWTYGNRTGTLVLPRMSTCKDYEEVKSFYANTPFPNCRIVLTGTGRVAGGSAKVLDDMGYRKVSPSTFIKSKSLRQVYTQLGVTDYAEKKDGTKFKEQEYYQFPEDFIIDFEKYYSCADILINGIFWDPKAPAFFSADDMSTSNFSIKVIADVTCDIAPDSSIPSTLFATTIQDPVFGYNPSTKKEGQPYSTHVIDVMSVDNLPNEIPRDASEAFGQMFTKHILPELSKTQSDILDRGTIVKNGKLTEPFKYLKDFVA